jgi:hypothetical protein
MERSLERVEASIVQLNQCVHIRELSSEGHLILVLCFF